MTTNGNMIKYESWHARPDVLEIPFRITGAGTGAPTDKDASQLGSQIASISRTSMGLYVITPRQKFNGEVQAVHIDHVGTTENLNFKVTAINLATPAITLKVTKPGGSAVPAWSAATAVTAHTTGALPAAGFISAVEVVAGGVVGPANIMFGAPAATHDVQVSYTAGVPTLNFLAGDAVTSVRYQQLVTAEAVVDIATTDSVFVTLKVRTSTRN